MLVLGIETSCDETSCAIVDDNRRIHAHVILSQTARHAPHGGVVPEIAAREHLTHIDFVIARVLEQSGVTFSQLDGVAATTGPGLIGGVMVGMMAGKALAASQNIPFIGINHLEGHLLSPRLVQDCPFPYLVLLVSGGHTQILLARDVGNYELWGTTRDDAAGECFDKVAKLMGLPFPGGMYVEKLAARCKDPSHALEKFPFHIPLAHEKTLDFSFSGLKTAARNMLEKTARDENSLAEFCYAFQNIIALSLSTRCAQAFTRWRADFPELTPRFVICGGVAANGTVREKLHEVCAKELSTLFTVPHELCTDNGAMIAWAGVERLQRQSTTKLNCPARPRWPLEECVL